MLHPLTFTLTAWPIERHVDDWRREQCMGMTRVNTNVNSKLRALISYWLTGMWTVVNLKLRQQAVAIHMDLYIYIHTPLLANTQKQRCCRLSLNMLRRFIINSSTCSQTDASLLLLFCQRSAFLTCSKADHTLTTHQRNTRNKGKQLQTFVFLIRFFYEMLYFHFSSHHYYTTSLFSQADHHWISLSISPP